MKNKKSYYFKECGMTLWLTSQQYLSLKQEFLDLAEMGSPVAAARLQGFGPGPQA
tara:strand:+ start:350 stop:514 length:165 start_codon:yes stop_codon:yes gene_type:complete